jgi:hypothetical protein
MGKSIVATTLLCVAFAIPFAANAGKLVVDYAGVVSSIDRTSSLADTPPYSVGDPITGRLIIDTALAPTDRVASDPTIGRYYGGSPSLDFILGAPHPRGNASADLFLVYNDWDPPSTGAPREDGIIIKDSSGSIDGAFNLLLGFRRPNPLGQVLADDSLSQSFVIERESGTNLWGYIERGFGEFRNVVDFTLDRLSVTPLVCRAP